MNQLAIDFDAHTLARSSDPITSHIAATRVCEFQSGHIGIVLAVLNDYGPSTADEIAKRSPERVWRLME